MPINFPNSPSLNQVYTFNGRSWEWTGVAWKAVTAAYGPTGPTGATALVFQASTPASTNVLWYDTDEPDVVAVPVGGATGQVLSKASATDYNTAWTTITVPETIDMFLMMGA